MKLWKFIEDFHKNYLTWKIIKMNLPSKISQFPLKNLFNNKISNSINIIWNLHDILNDKILDEKFPKSNLLRKLLKVTTCFCEGEPLSFRFPIRDELQFWFSLKHFPHYDLRSFTFHFVWWELFETLARKHWKFVGKLNYI